MQSLEPRPRITDNPSNAANYRYAGIAGFSTTGQSFPQLNIPRNPTLTDNPLDEYYADVYLQGYVSTGVARSLETVENATNNQTESRDRLGTSRSYGNETSNDSVSAEARRRYSLGTEARFDSGVLSEPGSSDEGETGDFGALPDIRESRV